MPTWNGSIGMPHRGVLTEGTELSHSQGALQWLRNNDRHYGIARFTRAIENAAAKVAHERPGTILMVGDLSAPGGGTLSPHLSHRTGRDADLLLYVTTLEGIPTVSPGFIHFGPDGLAKDHGRFYRFDVDRQWLLMKALLESPQARIQWMFISSELKPLVLEWARARGESPELIDRATTVMLQPKPGGVHDDHIHIRTACTATEVASGCERSGPERAWLVEPGIGPDFPPVDDRNEELVLSILRPLKDEPVLVSASQR